jgi:hypothetical protein
MAKKINVPEGDEDDERKGKVSWLPVILLLVECPLLFSSTLC